MNCRKFRLFSFSPLAVYGQSPYATGVPTRLPSAFHSMRGDVTMCHGACEMSYVRGKSLRRDSSCSGHFSALSSMDIRSVLPVQMGPSGSGKTSLLNVLAQRVPHKCVTGNTFVNGSPMAKSFKRRMGFVFQVQRGCRAG